MKQILQRIPLGVAALALVAATGCASTGGAELAGPAPLIAQRLVEATAPDTTMQLSFAWNLRERDATFDGQGVARIAPAYRGRLDLFGPRGETVLQATLNGERLGLPAGAGDAPLPPPALLWSVLGVLYPPAGAELTGTSTNATGQTLLEYRRERERWLVRMQGDALRHVEWRGPDGGRRTVELSGETSGGMPTRAYYRDWVAFRELTLELDRAEIVDAFDPDVFADVPR